MIKDFEKAKEQISAANSIGIISHINPDGDNIGSLIGLELMSKYSSDFSS